ncbi:MAG TPA: flagellar export chaperone FliS [Desulfotomaculum sp.]|nr:MAG: Flagellar protein FliS [Desulfotomaculum sp. 46_80]HAG11532.1 flagellar export chaperone FliS [Desulfotomaculum sp.]HBY03764.1 flagellar export chaperone FliS [Desulfotomaculum sp.]
MINEQVAAYAQNNIITAPPEKLVLMLYEGALSLIDQAKETIEKGEITRTNYLLNRSQKIINELRASLNFEAGDFAINLERLYEYIHFRLIQANIKKDASILSEISELLTEIKDAWAKGVCKMRV